MSPQTLALSYLTFSCCLVSLIGSILVITSYVIVRTASNPKAAQLIRNLALTDFIWFGSVLIQSSFWIGGNHVPDNLCYILSPTVLFFRMASLVWTCAISFDVLMSVTKRKWYGKNEESGWNAFRKYYYIGLFILAFPVALFNVISQSEEGNASLGCNPEVEELGTWYIIFGTEVIPITLGTLFNVFVFFRVRNRMSLKAYPQSVRKRRRRIMYHYIAVCIFCWIPTVAVYISLVAGYAPIIGFAAFARVTLYLSGFFNFLVFGMQDPHLKKSWEVFIHLICGSFFGVEGTTGNEVKFQDVEKSVMFEEASFTGRRQRSRDRYSKPTRHRRLSREEKRQLYLERPDLAPNYITTAAHASVGSTSPGASNNEQHVAAYIPNNNDMPAIVDQQQQGEEDDDDEEEDDFMEPLLESSMINDATSPTKSSYGQAESSSNNINNINNNSIIYNNHSNGSSNLNPMIVVTHGSKEKERTSSYASSSSSGSYTLQNNIINNNLRNAHTHHSQPNNNHNYPVAISPRGNSSLQQSLFLFGAMATTEGVGYDRQEDEDDEDDNYDDVSSSDDEDDDEDLILNQPAQAIVRGIRQQSSEYRGANYLTLSSSPPSVGNGNNISVSPSGSVTLSTSPQGRFM